MAVAAIDFQFADVVAMAEHHRLVHWHPHFGDHRRAIDLVPNESAYQREHRSANQKGSIEKVGAGKEDLRQTVSIFLS